MLLAPKQEGKEGQKGKERKEEPAITPPRETSPAKDVALAPPMFRLQMDIDHTLQKKLQEAQDLMPYGHNSLQEVLAKSLALLIEAQMKAKFKQVAQPRKKRASPQKNTRHIPSAVKREVALRDHFQCRFVGKSGRRCGEKRGLEYHHHIHAFALGGKHLPENLTLLCRRHNQWDGQQTFGILWISKVSGDGRVVGL
ncbi:MAG: HNH endonuclease signature motif containing protein [Myxococcota bacterium]|nr:HNH endonuclease signature motif containing protein [Myxococcota bacterium]